MDISTTLQLFDEIEALRVECKLSIEMAAVLLRVSRKTYLNWKAHTFDPASRREPLMRLVKAHLLGALKDVRLPAKCLDDRRLLVSHMETALNRQISPT
jgi:hypothetical protein